ncbi:DNA alkylation repair protein [Candidatus Curtissbacteria bacterium RIFCSPLOWO2_01_FULL_38_11b]|uniref:DNA alkylation repair protein n=1 Tax=Candidatus Curtissbacteria bacterium RIFCSPLOWO2_01_FULL_38_11b TaxID=1797725 RepID=A0A1F5GZW4_9BACT|nr:MAG: DNA alkylation repair protein [Candidatus Curtissbacteria bacterium RIFCSPLOWO2_01_FULL_38_11b]
MSNTDVNKLRIELRALADSKRARILGRFFKTGKGQYGEGDVFLGVTVPQSRKLAKKFGDLKISEIKVLLKSKIHEERLVALLNLVDQFQSADDKNKKQIFDFYLKNTKYVNNWDLVDLTAEKIVGAYLLDKPKSILYKLAKSKNLWERRIAIVATYYFIKNNEFDDTLKIAKLLLFDNHDLLHKAVGWMLREVGKKDQRVLEKFLKENYKNIPRTTLRYAIERFGQKLRQAYLFRA